MMFGVCHIIIHGQTILFSTNNLFLSLLIIFWTFMLVLRFHVVDITQHRWLNFLTTVADVHHIILYFSGCFCNQSHPGMAVINQGLQNMQRITLRRLLSKVMVILKDQTRLLVRFPGLPQTFSYQDPSSLNTNYCAYRFNRDNQIYNTIKNKQVSHLPHPLPVRFRSSAHHTDMLLTSQSYAILYSNNVLRNIKFAASC